MTFHSKLRLIAFALVLGASPVVAGEADVVEANITQSSDGTFRVDATVAHADTGWDHYADAFEVLALDGTVLGVRVLAHPHVNEQPFTRSLSGVEIPDEIDEVRIRAKDSVHEYGGAEVVLTVPRDK